MDNNEVKQWLMPRIEGLVQAVITEVGEGNVNDKNFSKYDFRWAFDGCRRAYGKKFGEKIKTETLFKLCREYMKGKLLQRGESEEFSSQTADRYFALRVLNREISLDALTREVSEYIRGGGKLYGVKAKELPFFERARSFQRNTKGLSETKLEEVISEVKAYYFSEIAPKEKAEQRLKPEDFIYMSMLEFNNAQTRAMHIQRLYEIAHEHINSDGSIDGVLSDSEWSPTLSSMELGLKSIEFVALLFPLESNMYISTGFVHSDNFSIIQQDLDEFVARHGNQDLVKTIAKHDKRLYERLTNLANAFPEGAVSIQELLEFYGYSDESVGAISGDGYDEQKVVEELRGLYAEALDEYLNENPEADEIDMRAVNRLMRVGEHERLYTATYRLAKRKGLSMKDYINGKELFAYTPVVGDDGEVSRVKKQHKGKDLPALSYEIGLIGRQYTALKIFNGKEYTKTLKMRMIEKMQESEILSNPHSPRELKLNERIRLARQVIDEVVEGATNKHAINTQNGAELRF